MIKSREQILQERRLQMEKAIPDIWDYEPVLYIGANTEQFCFKEQLQGRIVDVLEIDHQRCIDLTSAFRWIRKVIEGDVMYVDELIDDIYPVVMWFGGPSALREKEHVKPTLDKLFDIAKKLLVVSMPYGKRSYTTERLEYLKHAIPETYDWQVLGIHPVDLLELKFKVATLGRENGRISNMLAWRYKNEMA